MRNQKVHLQVGKGAAPIFMKLLLQLCCCSGDSLCLRSQMLFISLRHVERLALLLATPLFYFIASTMGAVLNVFCDVEEE
jgi:hypothetical protein